MYRAIDIAKARNGRTLLHRVSVSCEKGECLAVIGPNGAGKTVLLKSLSLADPPTEGSIEIDEQRFSFPADDARPKPWPHLTFVFQQLFLWPHLTLYRNISVPTELNGSDRRAVREDILALSEELGLGNLLDRYPNQVSGGERQRVAIARALILRPKWLLLDEPNSAQDVEQIGVLIELFSRLKQKGVGVILSTHLLGFAGAVADRVIFLDRGHAVEQGTKEILLAPRTERMRQFISMMGHARVS